MTLASMTGFARATASLAGAALAWEIKTVNAKGLDLRLRVPPGFDAREAGFRSRIGAALVRGTCQATLTVQRPPRPPQIRIDARLLRALAEELVCALPEGGGIGAPTMDGLLNIRGVVEVTESREDPGEQVELEEAADALLMGALEQLTASRKDEGAALASVLGAHLEHIALMTEQAEQAPGRTVASIRERISRSVSALTEAVPALDPARLHQEALLLAARSDIREELDRLVMHRTSAQTLLREGGAVGRRLDFLAQELAREANTLCAKSSDPGLTATGMGLRNRIEQFREQVQNLE